MECNANHAMHLFFVYIHTHVTYMYIYVHILNSSDVVQCDVTF